MLLLGAPFNLSAQNLHKYSLKQLLDTAKKTNNLLIIKEYSVKQNESKIKENIIKRYPSLVFDGSYQYNFNLPAFTVPAGTLGTVSSTNGTQQLLPMQDSHFKVGDKGVYSMNLGIYQPVLQQLKMETGNNIDMLDIKIGKLEKQRSWLQISSAIEQQYYLAMMFNKQIEVSKLRLALSKSRFKDGNNASEAGRTVAKDLTGLKIAIETEQLNILKLDTKYKDCLSILGELTNINPTEMDLQEKQPLNDQELLILSKPVIENIPDLQIAQLEIEKSSLAVKAARQSKLPDIGLIGGYTIQKGNPILPEQTPYIGLNLKWNLQDLFSGKEVENQRQMQLKQAETNLKLVRNQVSGNLERALRKVNITASSIATAKSCVRYSQEILKYQNDKITAGMEINSEFIEKQVGLAVAELELYQAIVENLLARSELNHLLATVE